MSPSAVLPLEEVRSPYAPPQLPSRTNQQPLPVTHKLTSHTLHAQANHIYSNHGIVPGSSTEGTQFTSPSETSIELKADFDHLDR
jgi:hypothetical protein